MTTSTPFHFTIKYQHQDHVSYLRVLSDIKWWVFRRRICKALGVDLARARLAYRQFHDVLHGSFCQLRGVGDWELVMAKLSQADVENSSTELEVMDSGVSTVRVRIIHCGRCFADWVNYRGPVGGGSDHR